MAILVDAIPKGGIKMSPRRVLVEPNSWAHIQSYGFCHKVKFPFINKKKTYIVMPDLANRDEQLSEVMSLAEREHIIDCDIRVGFIGDEMFLMGQKRPEITFYIHVVEV